MFRINRLRILVGYLFLILLVIVSSVAIYRRVNVQVRAHAWLLHTQEVISEIHRTHFVLVSAETGQRGFLFTGDREYLEPYLGARERVEREVSKLQALTADNPAQQARVAEIRKLSNRKLDELAQTVTALDAGDKQKAYNIVRTNVGKHTMDSLRAMMREMEEEEIRLQKIRSEEYVRSVNATRVAMAVAVVAVLLGLTTILVLSLKSIAQGERHTAELRAQEEWYRVTLSSVGDAVIATDAQGQFLFANKVAEELLGYSLQEVKGKAVDSVFHIFNEDSLKAVESPIDKVIEKGLIIGLANHTVLKRKDGSYVPIADSAAPIWDDNRKLIGVVLVFRDCSEERRKEDLLRRTEKLAVAGRLASTMAHEINNPLEAMMNILYLVRTSPELPSSLHGHVSAAEQELVRVSHLAKQTLGFYRETSSLAPVKLGAIIEPVATVFRSKLKNRDVTLLQNVQFDGPVMANEGELRQLLANLISNALDASKPGGTITVSTNRVDNKERSGVEIVVEDDGSGVDSRHLPNLFEPFFTTKQEVGTGLGLWVCKTIVEKHGGTIEGGAREDGKPGARFSVYIPYGNGKAVGTS